MPNVQFKIDENSINKLKAKLKGIEFDNQQSIIKKMVKAVGISVHERLVENVSNRILKRRTGNLARSIQWRTVESKNGISLFVGSGVLTGGRVPYANILETGGVIRPKRAKWLTIPLRGALTKAGATKNPSARDFPNTFIKKSKSGNLIIFQKAKGGIIPLFVLKKSVTIPEKAYLSKTLETMKPRIFSIMDETLQKELDKNE